MLPIVHGLEEEYAGQLLVEEHNADLPEAQALAEKLGVRGHPAYAIVDANANILWTGQGAVSTAQLRQFIQEHAFP